MTVSLIFLKNNLRTMGDGTMHRYLSTRVDEYLGTWCNGLLFWMSAQCLIIN